MARRLQRRRRDRRERRGTVVDDSDGALVGTMESAETPIPRTKVFSSWAFYMDDGFRWIFTRIKFSTLLNVAD